MFSLRFEQLILALEAAAKATGKLNFVVLGSAALVGSVENPSEKLTRTVEIDLYPTPDQKGFDLEQADREIGESSPFHQENGFYVERLGDWALSDQPTGWEARATEIKIGAITALCLHPLDLAYNKLNVGREKDFIYVTGLLREGIIDGKEFEDFIRLGSPSYCFETNLRKLAQITDSLREGAS